MERVSRGSTNYALVRGELPEDLAEQWLREGRPPLAVSAIPSIANVDQLAQLPGLSVLSINGVVIEQDSAVEQCVDLRQLHIADTQLRPLNLSRLKRLERLYLEEDRITAPRVVLDRLKVLHSSWKPASLESLQLFPALEATELVARRLVDLDGVERCASLERLWLFYAAKVASLDGLRGSSVRSFRIVGGAKLSSVEPLADTAIEGLALERCKRIESVLPLMQVPTLTRLVLNDETVPLDGKVRALLDHPSLRHLTITDGWKHLDVAKADVDAFNRERDNA